MKKLLLVIVAIVTINISQGQTVVRLSEISKHVNDSVRVEGMVYGVRYFPDSKNAPTLVNIGAAFPNQLLTVVIYGDDRKNFTSPPEEMFKDKQVTVTGRVVLYRDKPQIVVHGPADIEVHEMKN